MHGKDGDMDMKGFGWRVSLSILVGIGWVAFLVIWLFFFADLYTIYQNIAIFLVSILIVAAIMGAAWAPWGMKHGKDWECCPEAGKEKKAEKPPRKKGKK